MKKSNLTETLVLKLSELKPCRKKAEITVPAETVNSEMNSIAKEFARQANIPGFRAGKAPLSMVKKRFKENIGQELLRQFHLTAFDKIRDESETDPVTMPTPDSDPIIPKAGEDYKFTLTFEAAPELKLPAYKGVKLKKQSVKITDKQIDEEIDRYRDMYAEFKTVDTPAEDGDMLKVSFSSDLECPEDAVASYKRLVNAEDSWCWLSDPEMLPGITKALNGLKAGDKKTFTVTFPEDFTEPLLAGKKGKYNFTVKEVQRRIPIKDDKELCQRLNIKEIKVIKDQIRKSKEAEAEYIENQKLNQQALEKIVKEVGTIDLPPGILAQTVQMQFKQIINELIKSEDDVEAFKKDTAKHQKNAEKAAKERLTNFFIAKAITDTEKIPVTQSEIDARIKEISAAYGYKEKDLKQQMENSGGIEELHIDLTISKAARFIINNADFGEKAASEKTDTADKKKKAKKEDSKKK